MTKEQIIQNIKTRISTIESYHPEEYVLNKGILLELKDLLSMIEEDKPSLPSNIDEAALKAYPKMPRLSEPHGVIPADNKTHYLGDANEENRIAFKAGAEWMTEQGETLEGEVMKDINNKLVVSAKGLSGTETKFGDKVIVQIRKKQ